MSFADALKGYLFNHDFVSPRFKPFHSPYSSNVSDISGDDSDNSNDLKHGIQSLSPLTAIQRPRHLIDVPIEAFVDRSPFQKKE